MKIRFKIYIVVFIAAFCGLYSSENLPYANDIPSSVFQERRAELASKLSDKSLLLFPSASYYLTKRDISNKTLITPNLFYMTNLPLHQTVFIVSPVDIMYHGESFNEVLFIREYTEEQILWTGPKLTIDKAKEISGIKNVLPIDELDKFLSYVSSKFDTVFVDRIASNRHYGSEKDGSPCQLKMLNQLKESNESIVVKNRIPHIREMRRIKDKYEIENIRKAVQITGSAFKSLLKTMQPGMTEYQVQAALEYQYLYSGSERPAFTSIVAAGKNTCYLHYNKNTDSLKNGDLLLMDCGAAYRGYSSDITRTIPVSGMFTEEQTIIYKIVLEAQDSALTACKPGEVYSNIHTKAKEIIAYRLKELGIINSKDDVTNYFPHGTSHLLGINVHDVGKRDTVRTGMVLTIEPGIYIPEGSDCDPIWWNIGIRIEDDVLITKDGYEILSKDIPKLIDELLIRD